MSNDHLKAAIEAVEASNPTVESPAVVPDEKPIAAQPAIEDDDGEDETDDSAASDGSDAPAPRQNKGVGKRINELTKDKHDAIREREYWQAEAERLRALAQPAPEPVATQAAPDGRPTLEQFDFDQEAHAEAMAEWKFNDLTQKRTEQQAAQQRQKTLVEKESAFIAAHPDYEAVAKAPSVPITRDMAELIVQADNPPAIAYYLGQNVAEAAAIAQMPPIAAARAIGRIEATLSAPPAVAAVPSPPVTVTSAPAVASSVNARAPVTKPVAAMSVEDHIEQLRINRSRR